MKRFIALCVLFIWAGSAWAEKPVAPVFAKIDKPILVRSDHPKFQIKLQSNASTGYGWFLESADHSFITPLSSQYFPPQKTMPGASGYVIWTFQVTRFAFIVPRISKIVLRYARPWDLNNSRELTLLVVTNETQPTD